MLPLRLSVLHTRSSGCLPRSASGIRPHASSPSNLSEIRNVGFGGVSGRECAHGLAFLPFQDGGISAHRNASFDKVELPRKLPRRSNNRLVFALLPVRPRSPFHCRRSMPQTGTPDPAESGPVLMSGRGLAARFALVPFVLLRFGLRRSGRSACSLHSRRSGRLRRLREKKGQV